MMEQRATHPLDIDLLGYALGDIDAAFAAELDQHLGQCLLCRIHLNRIRRQGLDLGPESAPTFTYPEIAPTVLAVVDGQNRPATFRAGQLWLAGSTHRMLVWIEAVNETAGMATVLAATLDVDAADHTSLIVDVPALGREVAIFASIPGWIPLDRFAALVDDLEVIDEIVQLQEGIEQPIELTENYPDVVAADHPLGRMKLIAEVRVGSRISGGSDERLDFRQMLADQLAELDPENNDEDDRANNPPGELSHFDSIVANMRNELAHDLSSKRHTLCEVKHIDNDFLVGSYVRSSSVRPVATVHVLDCVMLVVASESSHNGLGFDPEDAYKLLLDSGASSLAVAEPVEPYLTRMFARPVLRPAFELPRATERHEPRPLWESRPLIQAVLDYLQGDVFPVESEPEPLARARPDLVEFLRVQALGAIDELRQIRAQKGKSRALKALGPEDAVALNDAIATSPNLGALLLRIEEITVQ